MSVMKSARTAIAFLAILSSTVRADGCVIKHGGQLVPEKEQRAFIDWQEGQERLFLAIRTAETKEPSLWLVPVPATPESIRVEPVIEFPRVRWATDPHKAARIQVSMAWIPIIAMDIGLVPLFCCMLGGGCGAGPNSDNPDRNADYSVFQRKEQHGMFMEVLTARTTAGLNAYLQKRMLAVSAEDLAGLASYLGGEFSLICAWTNPQAEPTVARAVCIGFPTEKIFYPLKPTRVYQDEIDTSIIVRGWVRPADQAPIPRKQFQYLRGAISKFTLPSWMQKDGTTAASDKVELLTRVVLDRSPQQWSEDLYLVPGYPREVALGVAVFQFGAGGFWLIQAGLALLLGLALPFKLVPREQRQIQDWWWGGLVGIGLCASVYFAGYAFVRWYRQRGLPQRPCDIRLFCILSLLPAGLLALVFLGFLILSNPGMFLLAVGVVAWLLFLLVQLSRRLAQETGSACFWFLGFVVAHALVYSGICFTTLMILN